MIQFRSKHPYSSKSKRWFPLLTRYMSFEELNFEDYSYILGDKIYHEPSPEAEQAFNATQIWGSLADA